MSTKGLVLAASIAALGAAACGSDNPKATVTGTVGGVKVTAGDAVSATLTLDASVSVAAVAITNFADSCTKFTANQEPKNGQLLLMAVGDFDAANGKVTPAAAAGTFSVWAGGKCSTTTATSCYINGDCPSGETCAFTALPPAKVAVVTYGASDATCKAIAAQSGRGASGTVTITKIEAGAITGTFDVSLSTGDRLTGTFGTSSCPGFAGFFTSTTPSTCI